MLNKKFTYPFILVLLGISIMMVSSCNKDSDSGGTLSNEVSLTNSGDITVTEKDTTITVSYEFVVPAREAGEATVNVSVEDLNYGTNYTTTPSESAGVITIPFNAEDAVFSFDIVVIDDDANLPNGKVRFELGAISGENANISTTAASFELTILDNEGESINPDEEGATSLGEVVPGTSSDAVEVTFTTLNVVSDITATASESFTVSATVDGAYEQTATLESTATSFFVKATPAATATLGSISGTVTLTSGEAETAFDVEAIVSPEVGVLFWVEDVDYPLDDDYPAIGFNGALMPTSAHLRMTANYNGSNAQFTGLNGLARTGVFDTWYNQIRVRGVGMGDNPLNFTGYPGSGIGRTIATGLDGSNQNQRNDCEFEFKNSAIARRFVDNGQEITSGNVYLSTMIKVNAVYPDAPGKTLKQAVLMLTGDATFVNVNAMKLNVDEDGNGGFKFGVSKSNDDGSVVYSEESYTLGATYVVVMKVEIKPDNEGADPNDVLSLYVFKEGDVIPNIETNAPSPVAVVNEDNQDITDVHDVTSGLETVFIREVGDAFAAGGRANIDVQEVEFSGIRVATSWFSLFKDNSEALYDSESEDELQILRYGNANCGGLGNNDN